MGKWRIDQETYRRKTWPQDLPFGQYARYRARFILEGDSAGAWADFGWAARKLDQLAIPIEIPIKGRAGISAPYDLRVHREMRKISPNRSHNTDYMGFRSIASGDICTGVSHDFEAHANAA